MIDTYFDRADNVYRINWLANPNQREEYRKEPSASPRYYKGEIYATLLDRNVAEAKENLRLSVLAASRMHRREVYANIRLGDKHSWFKADGSPK